MKGTKTMKASEVKKMADTLLENGGVGTRERFMQALPLLFSLKEAAGKVKQFAKALEASADELSRQAAGYAEDHATALDAPLVEVRKGIRSGTVEVGGVTYRLTVSPDKVVRLDGGTLTQEFLAGLPDGWTDIPWRGRPHPPDARRHRACGNSMCVNVMRWVGERIDAVEKGKEFEDYGSVKDRGDNGESPPLAQEGGG
jgi:DNA (cytosine-5)-methyltransferase 1